MRIALGLGFFLVTCIAMNHSTAHAQTPTFLQTNISERVLSQSAVLPTLAPPPVEPVAPAQPTVQTYKVVENDTLSRIADQYNTTWNRLFNKNLELQNPDELHVGITLTIPAPDEVVAERSVPTPAEPVANPPSAGSSHTAKPAVTRAIPQPTSSAGNTYTFGYCTWYAKNRRPDLPNNLGNADTWVARAAAQGIPTGSAPRPGAIGQQGMHVVYVESVNADGSVTISEMNYQGYDVISSRTVPASYFSYIY